MYNGSYSALTAVQDVALHVPLEWFVRSLVLASMTLQLVLVVLGARRYLSSSTILRFMLWGAYISADAVAISALGAMMYNDRRESYGIWAPLLLMHLGGPDSITAYSMADNELWLRHGFNMIYQVSMAVYVIYASSLRVSPLAAAIILLIVGSIKYLERILALKHGNYLRIVLTSLPISKYMIIKGVAEKWRYVVMGEDEVERTIEQDQQASSSAKGLERSFSKGDMVTIEDVERVGIKGRGYDLCLSHALFKMYKRRFGSSGFADKDWKESRAFWIKFSGVEAFRFVEMELKFMYDSIFSKYSNPWFTKWGMLLRFLNIILLGVAGYLILGERESRQAQRMVTYIVISVAFVVEVFQIWRVLVSDWTRVRLICAYVVECYRNERHILEQCRFQVIRITMIVVGKFQDYFGGNRYLSQIVGGNRYWSNQISQHCLIDTWLNKPPVMCKMAGLFPKPGNLLVSWYVKQRHTRKEHVEDDLKDFIFRILKDVCFEENSIEKCKENVYTLQKSLFERDDEILKILESHGNLEEVILMWHIATTLCDRQSKLVEQNGMEKDLAQKIETQKNVRWSTILSRYCAYLLLSRPSLLSLRPKMASIVYMQVVNQLLDTITLDSILNKIPGDLSRCNNNLLGSGENLSQQLLKYGEYEMWKLMAKYWGKLVIYMAVQSKAIFHAQCVAGGGEFLSLVWALLGHMGCREQCDSGATKQIENSAAMKRILSDREKELDAVKKDLDATKKRLRDLEDQLAATSSVPEIELA